MSLFAGAPAWRLHALSHIQTHAYHTDTSKQSFTKVSKQTHASHLLWSPDASSAFKNIFKNLVDKLPGFFWWVFWKKKMRINGVITCC